MSLHSIKSAKELLSREQGKSRNITLHFLGGEWIYNPLNEEESEKRKETEVGKYSASKIPNHPPKLPNPELKATNQETETQNYFIGCICGRALLALIKYSKKMQKGTSTKLRIQEIKQKGHLLPFKPDKNPECSDCNRRCVK